MNYEEFAQAIGRSTRSIRRWVSDGKLHPPPFSNDDIPAAKTLLEGIKEQRQANLVDHSAIDTSGGTVPVTCKLESGDAEWLRSLPEGASYHLRQAVRLYRQSINA